jgi:hypothetical protein
MEMPTIDALMPLTVPSAVEMLLKDLGDDSLGTLRATAYDDLIDHHFGLGLLIRNRCQLHDNPALVEATGTTTADDATLHLLQALWRRICH